MSQGILIVQVRALFELKIIPTPQPIQVLSSYCRLIRNDPDELTFDFSTFMIATGLNVMEFLLSISMII